MNREDKLLNILSTRKILVIVSVIIAISCFYFWNISYSKTKEITNADNMEMHRVVSEYYDYIEEEKYELALFNLDLSESLMDSDIMLRGLYDINKNVIEEFQVEAVDEEAYFSKEYNSVAINVNYILKYKGTIGGSTKDIVLMTQDDSSWKIKAIVGLDRYGFYRAPEYECQRLISFLDGTDQNSSVIDEYNTKSLKDSYEKIGYMYYLKNNLMLEMTKDEVLELVDFEYTEVLPGMGDNEMWRFDIMKDADYLFDINPAIDILDMEGLKEEAVEIILFISWDDEEKLERFTFYYKEPIDGSINEYRVFDSGTIKESVISE